MKLNWRSRRTFVTWIKVGRIVQKKKKNLCQADLPSLSETKLLECQEDKTIKSGYSVVLMRSS